ncbi:hypothetical protein AVEN_240474-1, partial [Araneus ventricosus]
NFGVGQNLAIQFASCSNCKEDDITKPKWADAIKDLYDEVLDFHKSWLDNFQSGRAETDVEHFTQNTKLGMLLKGKTGPLTD